MALIDIIYFGIIAETKVWRIFLVKYDFNLFEIKVSIKPS